MLRVPSQPASVDGDRAAADAPDPHRPARRERDLEHAVGEHLAGDPRAGRREQARQRARAPRTRRPAPTASCRCDAPSVRRIAASKRRSSCVAAIAACSTSRPAASVNRNTNSTARDTWSMIDCTCRITSPTSIASMFGILLDQRRQPGAPAALSGTRTARDVRRRGMPSSAPGGNSVKKFGAEAVPVDLAQAGDRRRDARVPAMSKVSVSPSFSFSDSAMPSSIDMPGLRRAPRSAQKRAGDQAVGRRQLVRPRQVELALGEPARARIVELRACPAARRSPRPGGRGPSGRTRSRRRSPARASRAPSSTWSGSTLTRNWFGASGGRLARQSCIRSPRTSVSSSSAIMPSASAPTCRLDAQRPPAQVGEAETPDDAALRQALEQQDQQPCRERRHRQQPADGADHDRAGLRPPAPARR